MLVAYEFPQAVMFLKFSLDLDIDSKHRMSSMCSQLIYKGKILEKKSNNLIYNTPI